MSGWSNRPRVEEGVHQPEPVELPLPGGAGAVLERVPDGAHAPDVVGHPGGRPVEGHREPALDVGPYLRAEPEVEAAATPPLEVPRDLGHRERAPCERDRDVRADVHPAGRARGKGEGEERVVARLERPRAVESHALEAKRLLPHPLEGDDPHLGVDLHSVFSFLITFKAQPDPVGLTSSGTSWERGILACGRCSKRATHPSLPRAGSPCSREGGPRPWQAVGPGRDSCEIRFSLPLKRSRGVR